MAPFPIRRRRPADLPAVADLLRATHVSDGYPIVVPPDLIAWAASADVIDGWVAEDATEVVGHAVLTEADGGPATAQWVDATGLPPAELAVVRRLVVHHRIQGTGTGRALLTTAVDAAHALGRRPVLDMSHNLAARHLYETADFTEVGAYDLDVSGHHLHVLTWIGPPRPT